ncbi:MAG: mandelate racemase/muconate lactonizing enzyme family protein [Planctomycetota bacterium]|jgi:L-alanine-DL-glutamate epimerase-like enolase superfamily enzyme|nr:mandelate racemase/muconate lactonizing enzyme family protein [Planctomycetota bacterium]
MSRITAIETFALRIPRDEPYLGPLTDCTATNDGYFVRPGNKSVYHVADQCVLVKISTESGHSGWGECVSFVAPQAVVQIIDQVMGPLLIGRDATDPVVLYHDCYDLMRVRGFFGGYWHDALSAIDIALWDLTGQIRAVPLCKLLGGQRHERIPAYVSGLPAGDLDARVAKAVSWRDRGFPAIKFASAVSYGSPGTEMAALREGLGPDMAILCDMHWRHTAAAAIAEVAELHRHNLALAEAPCAPEDINGAAKVAASVSCPVGIGEELRTVFEFRPRFLAGCMDVIQPEMGRTGISSFMEICTLARAFHARVAPHASIGIGLFQAASLHASAVLPHLWLHEYQHSIFDRNLRFLSGDMSCDAGSFSVPTGPGLGVAPKDEVFNYLLSTEEAAHVS